MFSGLRSHLPPLALAHFLFFKQEQELLFINVHPALLAKVDAYGKIFEAIVHAHSVPVENVVIELEESYLEPHCRG